MGNLSGTEHNMKATLWQEMKYHTLKKTSISYLYAPDYLLLPESPLFRNAKQSILNWFIKSYMLSARINH